MIKHHLPSLAVVRPFVRLGWKSFPPADVGPDAGPDAMPQHRSAGAPVPAPSSRRRPRGTAAALTARCGGRGGRSGGEEVPLAFKGGAEVAREWESCGCGCPCAVLVTGAGGLHWLHGISKQSA